MFCFTLLYLHSSLAIILMRKKELVALLSLSSWCLLICAWLFLTVPWVCLQFVTVVFPDHTHLPFLVLQEYWVLTESRISIKPVVGCVRIVALSITSYEQTP